MGFSRRPRERERFGYGTEVADVVPVSCSLNRHTRCAASVERVDGLRFARFVVHEELAGDGGQRRLDARVDDDPRTFLGRVEQRHLLHQLRNRGRNPGEVVAESGTAGSRTDRVGRHLRSVEAAGELIGEQYVRDLGRCLSLEELVAFLALQVVEVEPAGVRLGGHSATSPPGAMMSPAVDVARPRKTAAR